MSSTKNLTTLAILSALGAVLMLFEIPVLVMALDVSDVVVLIAFFLFGWKEAAFVGLMKALVHLLFKGAVGPFAVGQISAFIASMGYVAGLSLALRLGFRRRLSTSVFTILGVTLIMVVANYFFITPLWFGHPTVYHLDATVSPESFGLSFRAGYLATILVIFIPFNLFKGCIVLGLYHILARASAAYLE
ncbi:MAG: ECF transporter S component [Candidatus Izemoplasmataceae bacterium]